MNDFYYTKFYSVYHPENFTIWKVRNDLTMECCIYDPENIYDGKWRRYTLVEEHERQDVITEEDAFLEMI
jgi:hypothetical protein